MRIAIVPVRRRRSLGGERERPQGRCSTIRRLARLGTHTSVHPVRKGIKASLAHTPLWGRLPGRPLVSGSHIPSPQVRQPAPRCSPSRIVWPPGYTRKRLSGPARREVRTGAPRRRALRVHRALRAGRDGAAKPKSPPSDPGPFRRLLGHVFQADGTPRPSVAARRRPTFRARGEGPLAVQRPANEEIAHREMAASCAGRLAVHAGQRASATPEPPAAARTSPASILKIRSASTFLIDYGSR